MTCLVIAMRFSVVTSGPGGTAGRETMRAMQTANLEPPFDEAGKRIASGLCASGDAKDNRFANAYPALICSIQCHYKIDPVIFIKSL
jgi:hypothetical protein